MNIETEQLEAAIVEKAVAEIVDTYSNPDHDISTAIHEGAKTLIEERVNSALDSEIKAVIDGGLEKIVFPQTNNYGEKKNPDLTLREFIGLEVKRVFEEYLDNDGRPTNDSWYRKPECQRVNRVIKKAIEDRIQKDVIDMTTQIHANINSYIGEFVKTRLNEAAARLK